MLSSSSTSSTIASSSTHHTYEKNWEASFGQLASSYGFVGGVPSLPKKTKSSKLAGAKTPRMSVHSTTSSQSTLITTRSTKNYEAAFGHLSSTYGFAGSVPSLPSKASNLSKPSFTSLLSISVQSSMDYQRTYDANGDLSSKSCHTHDTSMCLTSES